MSDKMKAVVKIKNEPNGTEILTVDIPTPGPDDVLIKIKAASICGTDVHIYNWDKWAASRVNLPLIYGHEFAGEVVEVGKNVSHINKGNYVSGECHIACGHCTQCSIGMSHICHNLVVFGIDIPGIFAEYAVIPASNIWKNNPLTPPELCSIQDPLGNAVHSVFSTDIVGKDVVVIGLGPIGMMCVALCLNSGAGQVFAVEKNNEYRANLARRIGAHQVFSKGEDEYLKKEIFELTAGKGADVVLEMSGDAHAITDGLDLLRPGGDLILLGVYNDSVKIDTSKQIVFKCANIKGIYGRRIFSDWFRMRGLLNNAKLRHDLENIIITHRYPFEKFFDAMETMRSGQSGKIILNFDK